MASDTAFPNVAHRVVTEIAATQDETVHVSGRGDERVGDLDPVRTTEYETIASRLAADALVQLDAVEYPEKVADDEFLPGSETGVHLCDRYRRAREEITGRVMRREPRDGALVTTQPFNDDVGVEEELCHRHLPTIVSAAPTA